MLKNIIVLTVFLYGCFGIDGSCDEIGNSYLVLYDDPNYARLFHVTDSAGYRLVIDKSISEIGYDTSYIILMQYPAQGEVGLEYLEKSKKQYFIVQMQSESQNEEVYGPFNRTSFDSMKTVLRLSRLSFMKSYNTFPK